MGFDPYIVSQIGRFLVRPFLVKRPYAQQSATRIDDDDDDDS